MTIEEGRKLPDGDLMIIGAEERPETVSITTLIANKKVVIFGVPGAFSPICNATHIPGLIDSVELFRAKSIDIVACLTVNDPFVAKAWSDVTGATAAGIVTLCDPDVTFTRSLGLSFNAPETSGLLERSLRYAMLVEDGVVTKLRIESRPNICELSAGAAFAAEI